MTLLNAATEPDQTTAEPEARGWAQGLVYFVGFVALGVAGATLGPALPALAENTGTLLSGIGILFTARSLGYLLGSFLSGSVYDRVHGHPVMAGTLVVIALALGLVPVLTVLWILVPLLLILGLAEGLLDVGGNTLLVWVYRERVAPYMNALHFFFGVGAFLAPVAIAQSVAATDGIRWAFWILSLAMLPVAVWLLRTPSPSGEAEAAPAGGDPDSELIDTPVGRPAAQSRLLVLLIAIFFFLYVGIEIGFGGWVATYAVTTELAGEIQAAYLTSAFFGAFTLARLLSIPAAARLRPRTLLLVDLLGCLVSVGVILLWLDSLVALWIGAMGLGFSMASIFPTTLSLAGRRLVITGRVTSWFFVGSSLGGMTLPWLIGRIFDAFGPPAMMVTLLFNLFLALLVFAVLTRFSARLTEK
jgi:FHS family Na+ dependent glucose MFS transporter 1